MPVNMSPSYRAAFRQRQTGVGPAINGGYASECGQYGAGKNGDIFLREALAAISIAAFTFVRIITLKYLERDNSAYRRTA